MQSFGPLYQHYISIPFIWFQVVLQLLNKAILGQKSNTRLLNRINLLAQNIYAFSQLRYGIKTCYCKNSTLKRNSSSACFLNSAPNCCFPLLSTADQGKKKPPLFPGLFVACHVVSQTSRNTGESYATSKALPIGLFDVLHSL